MLRSLLRAIIPATQCLAKAQTRAYIRQIRPTLRSLQRSQGLGCAGFSTTSQLSPTEEPNEEPEESNSKDKTPHPTEDGVSWRLYELQVIDWLHSLNVGMNLVHRGKPSDGGVDFQGFWKHASNHQGLSGAAKEAESSNEKDALFIVGQCKRWKNRVGPKSLRELVGSDKHLPPESTIRIFVTTRGFTSQAMAYATDPTTGAMILIVWDGVDLLDFRMNSHAREIAPQISVGYEIINDKDAHSPSAEPKPPKRKLVIFLG